MNPRRTQRPETVFETVLNDHVGRSSAESLQALCKHCPSERCRCVPNQRIAPELHRLLEPFQRHQAARTDDVAQFCKPEVTGSIPVRSIADRRELGGARAGLRRVEDRLHVVAVGIEDERGEVPTAVLGPETRSAIVGSALTNGGAVPAFDRAFVRRDERDVRPSGRSVSTRPAAYRVQGEVVILSASEKDITIAFEIAFAEHREAELGQGGFIHSTARRQIADSEANVIDQVAHYGRVYDGSATGSGSSLGSRSWRSRRS